MTFYKFKAHTLILFFCCLFFFLASWSVSLCVCLSGVNQYAKILRFIYLHYKGIIYHMQITFMFVSLQGHHVQAHPHLVYTASLF